MSERRVFRVGISGSYGGLNLGDEAILQSIITQLRQSLAVEITVFSRNPRDTLRRHRVEHAFAVRDLGRDEVRPLVEPLDLLIVGGGGILFDTEARLYLREALLAQERGVPVMFYAVGAGPLADAAARELVRECVERAAVVTVRERSAKHLLEEIGVKREVRVTADPALLLRGEPLPQGRLEQEGLAGRRRLVGVSVREPGAAAPGLAEEFYHALLANAADFMADRFDADIVFVPMERQVMDLQHSHAVIARMLRAQRALVLKQEYTAGQMLSLLAGLDLAVGMRLHFLLFAALQGVPFVALSYAPKVSGFLEYLGMRMPPLHQVNAGRLLAHIDHSWDNRQRLRQQIAQAMPRLAEAARENNRLAVSLLTCREQQGGGGCPLSLVP